MEQMSNHDTGNRLDRVGVRNRLRIAAALFLVAAIISLIADNLWEGVVLLVIGLAMVVASRRYE